MIDYIWETFDSLFKTVYRQGRRIEELDARIAGLEKRLNVEPAPKPEARAEEGAPCH